MEDPFASISSGSTAIGNATTGLWGLDYDNQELQLAANHRLIGKLLRPRGVGAIIFGLIAVATGAITMNQFPVNGILLLIGIAMTAEGIWLVVSPSRLGLMISGIALIVVGLWNIGIAVLSAMAGQTSHWIVIGAYQIFWAIRSIARYGSLSDLPDNKPSRELTMRVDAIVKILKLERMATHPDIIEFTAPSMNRTNHWKGRLSDPVAIFAGGYGDELIFANKHDIAINTTGNAALSKSLKAEFHLGDRTLRGTISPAALARFEQWRNSGAATM